MNRLKQAWLALVTVLHFDCTPTVVGGIRRCGICSRPLKAKIAKGARRGSR